MDINALLHLRYVFAAVEHGSMRQVAHALGVHESSVSRNILALEQYLDLQLFDRRSNGIRLTRAGQAWLDEVCVHYERLEEALSQAALRNSDTKTLRIGFCSSVGQDFLVNLISRFEKSNPGVGITIEDVAYTQYAYAIRRRALDVVFIDGSCHPRLCRSAPIWEERLAILLPARHVLCGKQFLVWADLMGERLLIPTGRSGTLVDPHFLEHFGSHPEGVVIQYRHASHLTILLEVQLGKGIVLASESLTRIMRIDRTEWRPIVGSNSVNRVSAVWLESNPKRAVFRLIAIAKHLANEGRANTGPVEDHEFLV